VAQREERAPGLLERLARTLAVASPEMFISSATAPRVEQDEATIVKMTERVIAEAAAHGRIVLVGRGAQAVLAQRPDALHVYVVAPKPWRMKLAVERLGVDPASAAQVVDETDRQRDQYVKTYYGRHRHDFELRPGGEHRAAGAGRGGGGDRGGGAAAAVDVSALGTACAVPAACALVSGCARGPAPAPSLAAESALPVAVMPFEPYGGLLYVRSVVNRDSAWLILDTGTSHTGLDREWAWTTGALPVAAPGAPAPQVAETASAAVVDTMHLAGLALANYQVALYALRGVSEASGRPERGFVGHDVLRRFTVEIDYREQRVRLYDPARYRYAGSGTVVPFAADDDRPLLHGSITVPGRPPIPARLLLDTGASGLCLILTVPFVERYGLAGAVSPAIEAPIGTGLAGQLRGTLVRLKELRLAGLRVASPTTGLGGERTGFLARSDLDGVIGNPVFEDSRLIVDYARRRVIIEPRAAARCDYDMSGLRLTAQGPELRHIAVEYVVPHSPAERAGIRAGDELLLMDGHAVGDAGLSDVRRALRVNGALRRLVLRRDADTIRVTLQLRRLL